MITLFESYKNNGYKGNEHKFFFRRTTKSSKQGNLCLLLNVSISHYTGKGDYELKVLNIPYGINSHNKFTYKKHLSSEVFSTEKLYYSSNTWHSLEFLTAKEFFYKNPELFRNLYYIIKLQFEEKSRDFPVGENNEYNRFKLLYNLMKEMEGDIDMFNDSEKYNL